MDTSYLSIKRDREWYRHNVSVVREDIPYQAPIPVPGNTPVSLGILKIRENVISVFSDRSLLAPSPEYAIT